MRQHKQISPLEFNRLYESGALKNGLIIDVREPFEWEYYHLEESKLIPMQTIPQVLDQLPEDKTLYIICAHGVRSETACRFLTEQGFEDVVNVAGGMAAVAAERGFAYD
ncbi:rhodanese-like domain-containing protein [Paenibacillus alkalitolerans]|uniref:rhodanese-like domain-containing protein n=1 Tax=Paenibacillus alkalitolerans TaxID=2799335 RepID=UPI0018F51717|nr:rhodanese-like domain-containing protein [Paenibacillus alkalitolerans]